MADIPANPRNLAQEVVTFCDGAAANPAEYGTTPAELADLRAFASTVIDAENQKDARKNEYAAAVTAAENAEKALEDFYRPIRRDAYDTATDEELAAVGLAPHRERSLTTPQAPLNLLVTPGADGTNRLFWKNGDDVASTLYDIEAQVGNDPQFRLIYSTSARKFDHKGQTPGVKIVYRVSARRRGISSPFSNLSQAY